MKVIEDGVERNLTAQEEAAAVAQQAIDKVGFDAAAVVANAEAARISAVRLNTRRAVLVTAIQNKDDAQLLTAIAARYPTLTGDALKSVQDLVLLVAGVIRS